MRKHTARFAALALLAALFAAGGPLAAQTGGDPGPRERPERLPRSATDGVEVRAPDDLVQVFVQLDGPSVAEQAAAGEGPAAQRAHGRAVLAQQDRVRSRLGELLVEERSNLVVGANGFRAMVRLGDIPAIAATDEVESVAPVTRYELTNESSVPWIGGEFARAEGYTGEGVSIAVIDTGIDYTHSALGGSGATADYEANDPGVIEAGTFPTPKVVGGFDFAGPTYDASDPGLDVPSPDPDPLDVHGHGTHVAATAAGIELDSDDVGTGMAPEAELYAFKVFGDAAGSTDLVSDAIERALDPNNDLSMDDAVDVINMSLGSPFGHPDDPSAIASQNAVENGVVVVAAAGNSGPVPYVTGSPAIAGGVMSVAASIDGGVEVLGLEVTAPDAVAGVYEAQPGDFGDLSDPTTGSLAVADPLDACTSIAGNVEGRIALIQRGTCTFTTKIRHAAQQGAIGAVVFNDREEPPIAMAHDGTEPQPDIPAVMIGLDDGETLAGAAAEATVEVVLSNDTLIPKPGLGDNLADFTSRGPGFGNVFKPDMSAPGFAIRSADVGTGTGAALSSGTSMAAPHVAGAAAQVLHWNGDLTPAQVKMLLMNSATPANVEGEEEGRFEAGAVPIAGQGTGIVRVDRVVGHLGGYAAPGGLAFHSNPVQPTTETATVEVSRLDGDTTYDVAMVPNQSVEGVTWSTSADTVTTTGGSASLEVTVAVDPSLLGSDDGFFSQTESDGWLVLTSRDDPQDRLSIGLVSVADPAATVEAAGDEGMVDLANSGPGDGFAEGFTHLGGGVGSLAELGFRTGFVPEEEGGPYRTIDFGVALSETWASPSALEIHLLLDVDEDGTDDYALVAADLGILQGGDPTGRVATAIFDLSDGSGTLLYFAVADLNDRVIVLPADLTGEFGFLAEGDESFHLTVSVFDRFGLAGVAEDVTVHLGQQITSEDPLSLVVPAGASGRVSTEGEGEMLWLFQNNPAADQHVLTEVTAEEEAPPGTEPPQERPAFEDVPDDHLFHTEILWLARQDITRGCNPPANDRFCPDRPVTRGQMAAFLNRALDLAPASEDFFVDDHASIFQDDIDRLAAAGITRGCNPPTNDEYCPTDTLTRAQMATFMVRGFGFTAGAGEDLFVDDEASVHRGDIDVIGTAGVTRGCNPPANDRFCPEQDMTRGQMAAFIYRAFQAAGLMD